MYLSVANDFRIGFLTAIMKGLMMHFLVYRFEHQPQLVDAP